ncbi:MAG: tRNA 2-thiocytidine biosynthesis TtcA family protein [Chlamydiales bacterium]|nr:tRNA 2-thiocytidine biosynthesis TtcA family protein [Chlamydiales bacterium]
MKLVLYMDIHLPIAAPPWTHLGKKLESAFRKAIYEFQMLEKNTSIAVALSGGKDSLTLLFLLKAICGHGFPPFDIHAIHVGGEFSCGAGVQENFLRAICNKLNIPFHVRISTQKQETLECYSCSRERRRLIFDCAKSVGAHTIAFGHHRDDSAQTLLMNLLHKGEFAANLPKIYMHDYDVTIIRPLIYLSENEIRTFAKMYGFERITCQCPVGQDSMRKKSDKLLDELENLFPNARANIARAGLLYGSTKASKP